MSVIIRNENFLSEMGVEPLWVRRDSPLVKNAKDVNSQEVPDAFPFMANDEIHATVRQESIASIPVREMDWNELKDVVAGCMKCNLCNSRTKTVFGVGDEKAKWLFVGEGPGRNEDLKGEPFVGPAGKLLDSMLLAMGLKRGENAYIANIVKCRPIDKNGRDRPPTVDEANACMPYLLRQIAHIQPAIIVALGKTAALSLLQLAPDTPVSQLRGKVHTYAGLPVIVTYHPAYLLRNLADKKKSWIDLSLAMKTYAA